ncbi:integrase core domain-containing protein [Actinopolymorpha rutila]|uniref:integrase core domain-containing protein n=1 Tax=Actinopolymorpha rutila TaxID=446787 RepID=UPI003B528978
MSIHLGRLRRPRHRLRRQAVGRPDRQCWDNALAESFFASLKGECLDTQPWPTRAHARHAIVDYIAWYNGTRLHSALGYLTPTEYEHANAEQVTTQIA